MNELEHEQLRERIVDGMRALGRPSKLENRYFRFQKALGEKKTLQTTVAVYFRDIDSNLLELAFETGAVAESIGRNITQVSDWVSLMQEATGTEVHPNSRRNYPRVGLANKDQLEDILNRWHIFCGPAAATPDAAKDEEEFVSVPFYIESDGSKTLFLPPLKRSGGFQIGEKEKERYIVDYWDALAALREMSVPRFRRPNKSNNFGIVACNPSDFDEVKRRYIEDQLKSLHV